MAVALGVRQPLHQQRPDAFGEPAAVGGGGEGLTAAVRRQHPLPAELHERHGIGHDRHAAGEGERTLVASQRLNREVQRDDRRRAGGVDRHRGSLEAKGVRDPSGDDAGDVSDQRVALDSRPRLLHSHEIAEVAGADIDTRTASLQRVRGDTRTFEGLPGNLQHQSLLRVHRQRLARRNAEQRGVELGRVEEESALTRVGLPGAVRVRVVEPVEVPAPVGRETGDGVASLGDELPQTLRRGGAAGEPAGHAHDRDRLVFLLLDRAQPLASLVQVGGDPLQVVHQLVLVSHLTCFPS